MFKKHLFRIKKSKEGEKWLPLLEKNGYPDAAAASAAPKLERMDPELQKALLRWDKIGAFPDREIEGFTVAGLVDNVGLHPIGAFLMMDWLLREPDEAKYALAQPITTLELNETALEKISESEEMDLQKNEESEEMELLEEPETILEEESL